MEINFLTSEDNLREMMNNNNKKQTQKPPQCINTELKVKRKQIYSKCDLNFIIF